MTIPFYLSVPANPFCQPCFIGNKSAYDTLGPDASLNKSLAHSAFHRVHRVQKGPERLRFHMEDAHQMRGRERQSAAGEVQVTYCISSA